MFAVLAISLGAAAGALLRWQLGVWLNAALPSLPPGTLAANLIGAYAIGLLVAWFGHHPQLPPELRLFAITGFLGALTTFSTFSAEVVTNLLAGRWLVALGGAALHLFGSLALTALGIATVRSLSSCKAIC